MPPANRRTSRFQSSGYRKARDSLPSTVNAGSGSGGSPSAQTPWLSDDQQYVYGSRLSSSSPATTTRSGGRSLAATSAPGSDVPHRPAETLQLASITAIRGMAMFRRPFSESTWPAGPAVPWVLADLRCPSHAWAQLGARCGGTVGVSTTGVSVTKSELLRMDNMGIVVESLDEVVAFFEELGMTLEGRAMVEGEWAGRVTGLGDQQVEVAMMVTPDGNSRLELSRFLDPPVVSDHRTAPVNSLGYLRAMFTVSNIDETLDRLK